MLLFKDGDLFAQPMENVVLAHACNCRGVWGSGIAKTFAEKFPKAYSVYRMHCDKSKPKPGDCLVINETLRDLKIACLFTSDGYGIRKDPLVEIVKNTYKACGILFHMIETNSEIHSPKINSGLFGVPWEQTEKAIDKAMTETEKNFKWIVYSP